MTCIARQILNLNDHDNMILDRLVDGGTYKKHMPIQIIHNGENETSTYIFKDGSRLIKKINNDWKVVKN